MTRRQGQYIGIVLCIIIFYGGFYLMRRQSAEPAKASSYPADVVAQQPERLRIIKKATDKLRVFSKIDDRGDFSRLYVTPLFLSQDYDSRKTLVHLVLSYYAVEHNIPAGDYFVVIHDGFSGKEIGTYQRGLLSMNK